MLLHTPFTTIMARPDAKIKYAVSCGAGPPVSLDSPRTAVYSLDSLLHLSLSN